MNKKLQLDLRTLIFIHVAKINSFSKKLFPKNLNKIIKRSYVFIRKALQGLKKALGGKNIYMIGSV